MEHKDTAGVSLLIAAISQAATYDRLEAVKAITNAGMKWANAETPEAELAAWREIEEAAGWCGKFNPAA